MQLIGNKYFIMGGVILGNPLPCGISDMERAAIP